MPTVFQNYEENCQFKVDFRVRGIVRTVKRILESATSPHLGEDLYLSLIVSNVSVNTMLIREEEGTQLPVYYVSHLMVLVKMRYSNLEKLALAFLVAL